MSTMKVCAAVALVLLAGCTAEQRERFAKQRACRDSWDRYEAPVYLSRKWTLACAKHRPLAECEEEVPTLYPPVPQPTCERRP